MKIHFDIDATPQELRAFFGLPDVGPLQEELLAQIRDKMIAGIEGFDPMALLKPLMPPHLQSLEAMQRAYWKALTGSDFGEAKKSE
jgi:hypothetical protein